MGQEREINSDLIHSNTSLSVIFVYIFASNTRWGFAHLLLSSEVI